MMISILWDTLAKKDTPESTLRMRSFIETVILTLLVGVWVNLTANTFHVILGLVILPVLCLGMVAQFQLARKQKRIEELEKIASNSLSFKDLGANMVYMNLKENMTREDVNKSVYVGKSGQTGIGLDFNKDMELIGIESVHARTDLPDEIVENVEEGVNPFGN